MVARKRPRTIQRFGLMLATLGGLIACASTIISAALLAGALVELVKQL